MRKDSHKLLNKRYELMVKCRHESKILLINTAHSIFYQPALKFLLFSVARFTPKRFGFPPLCVCVCVCVCVNLY